MFKGNNKEKPFDRLRVTPGETFVILSLSKYFLNKKELNKTCYGNIYTIV